MPRHENPEFVGAVMALDHVGFSVGVMFFAGVSYWGKTKLRFVQPKAKINANYYINNLLSPLFQHDIPEMFKGRKYLPVFHHDNAPAHACLN